MKPGVGGRDEYLLDIGGHSLQVCRKGQLGTDEVQQYRWISVLAHQLGGGRAYDFGALINQDRRHKRRYHHRQIPSLIPDKALILETIVHTTLCTIVTALVQKSEVMLL